MPRKPCTRRALPRRAATLPLALFLSAAVHAADPGVVEMGKQRYLDNCAVCHGADGKGGGPFTPMLKSAPSDLTVLSAQNDGEFPFNKVYDTIDGRGMPTAHGTADMPIWGRQWKNPAQLGGETEVRGRILETLVFLRSIQQ